MASNVQLATALGAATGTGFLFVPHGSYGDIFRYIQSGASGRPAELTFKRTAPKPTSTFPGVDRGSIKLVEYFTVSDVEYSAIAEITTSIPVPVSASDRAAFALRMSLLGGHGTLLSDLAKTPASIPV